MIRAFFITDDRGGDRPVHADDLLIGEPWNAARSTDTPSGAAAPRIYRTWLQRLGGGLSVAMGVLILGRVAAGLLNISTVFGWVLAGAMYASIFLFVRRYQVQLQGMFWRRRFPRKSSKSHTQQHARLAIKRHRVCPCCSYSLADTPSDPDGCTLCPECGAAWCIDAWLNDAGIYRFPAVSTKGDGFDRGRAHAPDGRGVVVPLLARRDESERFEAIRTCPARPARIRLQCSLVAWGIQLVLMAVAAYLCITIIDPEGASIWFATLTLVAMFGLFFGILVWSAYTHQLAWSTHPHLIGAAVAKQTCPCCESTLRPTPSPIDARLLCDTCGSAWDPPAKA